MSTKQENKEIYLQKSSKSVKKSIKKLTETREELDTVIDELPVRK